MSLKQTPTHPWKVAQDQSIIARLLGWSLLLLAASLPLEGVLRTLDLGPVRSLPFYLSTVCSALAVLRVGGVLRNFARSRGMLMVTAAFAWSCLLYVVFPMREHGEVVVILQLVIMTAMLMYIAHDPRWRNRVMWAYWIGWVALTLLSLKEYLSNSVSLMVHGDIVRVEQILGTNTNDHAYLIGVGLLMSLALLRANRHLVLRIIIFAMLLVGSLVLLFGNSKGATLGLLVTIGASVVVDSRFVDSKPSAFITRGLLVVILIGSLYLVFTQLELGQKLLGSSVLRFEAMFNEGDLSMRDVLVERSLELALQYPTGVGQGNSMALLAQFNPDRHLIDTHNYYLRMLIDGGIMGFILFISGLLMIVRNGWRWYVHSRNGIFFWPLLYVLWSASISGGAFHNKFLWFFLAMNALTPLMINREAPPAQVEAAS